MFDWREYVYRYPYLALGAAASAGYLVSRFFRHIATPRERIMNAFGGTLEEITDNLKYSFGTKPTQPAIQRGSVSGMLTKAIVYIFKCNSGFTGKIV
jgi:hypothetical protein